MIEFRTREQIDDGFWNELIERSSNGLIYARTGFLDLLSPNWSALVLNHYEAVMPLTSRKKYGISYLYQPPFLQQLGVFGKADENTVGQFITAAKTKYRFAEIHLNYNNPNHSMDARQNFILSLNSSYDTLASGFSTPHIKNLKRAGNAGLRYIAGNSFKENIRLNYELYGNRIRSVKRSDYDVLTELALREPTHFLLREVLKDDELLASSVCFYDGRRIYFIMSSVTEAGKKNQANHFLVDGLIREFAGQKIILDFEGSDMPGVADFYQGFGAINQPYYFLKWNHLPWPYKWIKK
ncbi:MAG TPA: hypothetical protein VK166_12915 [Chitinophagaceae bacterium]|nr:hypothetical protein [Chitinophagaceae bacterium]